MSSLSPGEVDLWADKYDEDSTETDARIETELTETLQDRNFLTASQLMDALEWKLQGQGGRTGVNQERLQNVAESPEKIDSIVQKVTEAAFTPSPTHSLQNGKLSEGDQEIIKHQVKILSSLPGIGNATATALLTFHDPVNYAVGDRYIFEELFGEEQTVTPTNYLQLLEELKKRNQGGHDLRRLEKAYYKKYRDENEK